MHVTMLRRLKLASVLEGTTLILLVCIAVPLKYVWEWPLGVRLMGPVHGIAFLAYCWLLLETVGVGLWLRREATLLLLSAFVPFASILSIKLVEREIRAGSGEAPGR
ncbi:DUF3817 domain-containing protein [Tardiphaga sp. 768_D3_N2_1]|uniref:DUF3817 domain-containing protein n=1 Tax=Tardiphaga sp. 768_D3_N2_1 TaxID=3240783 RepID=UPI003F8C8CAB